MSPTFSKITEVFQYLKTGLICVNSYKLLISYKYSNILRMLLFEFYDPMSNCSRVHTKRKRHNDRPT